MPRPTILLAWLLGASAALHLGLVFWLPVTSWQGGASPERPATLTLRLNLNDPPARSIETVPAVLPTVTEAPTTAAPTIPAVEKLALPLPLPSVAHSADDYFRRAQLSVPAEPLVAIVIPDPGIDLGSGVKSLLLTLFISESGQVDRIEFDQSDAPAAMVEAARKAFSEARFAAGQIDGRPVKSRMRVEVGFEAMPPGP